MNSIKDGNKRVLHCVKRIVGIETLFNAEVDELLEALGLTRGEINGGKILNEKDS